jgi:hypothetical protein
MPRKSDLAAATAALDDPRPDPQPKAGRPVALALVRLVKPYRRHWPGDVIHVRAGLAHILVTTGAAELVTGPPTGTSGVAATEQSGVIARPGGIGSARVGS